MTWHCPFEQRRSYERLRVYVCVCVIAMATHSAWVQLFLCMGIHLCLFVCLYLSVYSEELGASEGHGSCAGFGVRGEAHCTVILSTRVCLSVRFYVFAREVSWRSARCPADLPPQAWRFQSGDIKPRVCRFVSCQVNDCFNSKMQRPFVFTGVDLWHSHKSEFSFAPPKVSIHSFACIRV